MKEGEKEEEKGDTLSPVDREHLWADVVITVGPGRRVTEASIAAF